jgi:hypothetical protein
MKTTGHLAAAALIAVLAATAAAPSPAAAKTKTAAHCTRNSVSNVDAASGTNAATMGITTSVKSTTPNFSGAPVQNNTPANTNANNINSNSPGIHQKQDPCKVATRRRHHR